MRHMFLIAMTCFLGIASAFGLSNNNLQNSENANSTTSSFETHSDDPNTLKVVYFENDQEQELERAIVAGTRFVPNAAMDSILWYESATLVKKMDISDNDVLVFFQNTNNDFGLSSVSINGTIKRNLQNMEVMIFMAAGNIQYVFAGGGDYSQQIETTTEVNILDSSVVGDDFISETITINYYVDYQQQSYRREIASGMKLVVNSTATAIDFYIGATLQQSFPMEPVEVTFNHPTGDWGIKTESVSGSISQLTDNVSLVIFMPQEVLYVFEDNTDARIDFEAGLELAILPADELQGGNSETVTVKYYDETFQERTFRREVTSGMRFAVNSTADSVCFYSGSDLLGTFKFLAEVTFSNQSGEWGIKSTSESGSIQKLTTNFDMVVFTEEEILYVFDGSQPLLQTMTANAEVLILPAAQINEGVSEVINIKYQDNFVEKTLRRELEEGMKLTLSNNGETVSFYIGSTLVQSFERSTITDVTFSNQSGDWGVSSLSISGSIKRLTTNIDMIGFSENEVIYILNDESSTVFVQDLLLVTDINILPADELGEIGVTESIKATYWLDNVETIARFEVVSGMRFVPNSTSDTIDWYYNSMVLASMPIESGISIVFENTDGNWGIKSNSQSGSIQKFTSNVDLIAFGDDGKVRYIDGAEYYQYLADFSQIEILPASQITEGLSEVISIRYRENYADKYLRREVVEGMRFVKSSNSLDFFQGNSLIASFPTPVSAMIKFENQSGDWGISFDVIGAKYREVTSTIHDLTIQEDGDGLIFLSAQEEIYTSFYSDLLTEIKILPSQGLGQTTITEIIKVKYTENSEEKNVRYNAEIGMKFVPNQGAIDLYNGASLVKSFPIDVRDGVKVKFQYQTGDLGVVSASVEGSVRKATEDIDDIVFDQSKANFFFVGGNKSQKYADITEIVITDVNNMGEDNYPESIKIVFTENGETEKLRREVVANMKFKLEGSSLSWVVGSEVIKTLPIADIESINFEFQTGNWDIFAFEGTEKYRTSTQSLNLIAFSSSEILYFGDVDHTQQLASVEEILILRSTDPDPSVTGVNDVTANKAEVLFYNNTLHVTSKTTVKRVQIVDVMGRVVCSYAPNQADFEINLSHLQSGKVYIAVVDGNRTGYKFLKP